MQQLIKRISDIVLSLTALAISSPAFAIMFLVARLGSHGPVFLKSKTAGRHFKPFELIRFNGAIKNPGLGSLPALISVLKGDMSLVGPRPFAIEYAEKHKNEFKDILCLRPGIFDISPDYSPVEASVEGLDARESGNANRAGHYASMLLEQRVKASVQYAKNLGLRDDISRILRALFNKAYPQSRIDGAIDLLSPYRIPIVAGSHLLLFLFSYGLSFVLRFEGAIPPYEQGLFLKYLPVLIGIRILFLFWFSLHRGMWRYVSTKDLANITLATTLGTLVFFATTRYAFPEPGFPRSIYAIDWLLNIMLLGGIRLLRRLNDRNDASQNNLHSAKKRVLVIGGGSATEMLLRDIDGSPFYPFKIIGIIDDERTKKGLKIRNVPILGGRKELGAIIEDERPDEFLLAIPSATPAETEDLIRDLRQYALPIKTLPGLWGILTGREELSSIKVVEPDDMLFRPPVNGTPHELKAFFKGKRVLITGAGGSIGSELSRQAASFAPQALMLFERHEESLYKIDMELREWAAHRAHAEASKNIHPVLGDILDRTRIRDAVRRFKPHIIFHAAAYKHVPLVEKNPYEAFRTNALGTRIVAEAAGDFSIERFVLISTDKAVNPESVMGATKRIAEETVRYYSLFEKDYADTKYITVRFGNVLGSSGSVVPLFKEQIKRGGPITVTHPDITRYFMTIPEAVTLVLKSAEIGGGGDVLVLDMGEPVRILDLAKRLIGLYGFRPFVDIDITYTGLRPGEKLHEELFCHCETIKKSAHPKITIANSKRPLDKDLLSNLDSINSPAFFSDNKNALDLLNKVLKKDALFIRSDLRACDESEEDAASMTRNQRLNP